MNISEAKILIKYLEDYFPELVSDEELPGADAVDRLSVLYRLAADSIESGNSDEYKPRCEFCRDRGCDRCL